MVERKNAEWFSSLEVLVFEWRDGAPVIVTLYGEPVVRELTTMTEQQPL